MVNSNRWLVGEHPLEAESEPRLGLEACPEPRVGERYRLEFFEDRSTLLGQHSPNARAAGRLN